MNLTTPDLNKLPVMTYQGQAVCTTEMLAQFYGTQTKTLRDNFAHHKDKFEAGKHYISLEGEELRGFQRCADKTGSPFSPSKFAAKINLWTERGAARHAKILETDQAWDVWETMEDAYFHRKGGFPASADGAHAQLALAQEIGFLKNQLAHRDRIIAAKDKAIMGLQGSLIGSLKGENRLLKTVGRLEKRIAKSEGKELVILMESQGFSRAEIAARTGKTRGHIRVIVCNAKLAGRLPRQGELNLEETP